MSGAIVSLSVEERKFHLKLPSNNLAGLESEFHELCQHFPVLLSRLGQNLPRFSWKKVEFAGTPFENDFFEILHSDKINNYAVISVKWIKRHGGESTETQGKNIDYTENGTHDTSDNSAMINQESNECQSNTSDPPRPGIGRAYDKEKLAEYYTQPQWESLSPAEQDNELVRLEQHRLLESMEVNSTFHPIVATARQTRKRPATTQNTTQSKNSGSTNESRRRSTRAHTETRAEPQPSSSSSKENQPPNIVVPSHFLESEDEDDIMNTSISVVEASTSSGTTRQQAKAPKLHLRKWGSRFNEHNSLPSFSAILKQKLESGNPDEINMHKLLSEIKAHIISGIKPGSKVEPRDYNTVCKRIVKEYPILGDVDNNASFEGLKLSVRKSFSQEKYYNTKGKEKRKAKKLSFQQPPRDKTNTADKQTDPADFVTELKENSSSETRMRFLVRSTISLRNTQVEVGELDEFLSMWPHYKNGELLIYEYALKENFKLEQLYRNASSLLIALERHFNEQDTLSCITTLQEKLTPDKFKNDKVKPLVSVLEAVIADGDPGVLDDNYEERSPHVIVTADYDEVGDRVPVGTFSKLSRNCNASCTRTDPATILILSIAPYFLFNLAFPAAYESTLRVLEKCIHGSLSEYSKKKTGRKEYKSFMAKFKLD